MSRRPIEAKKRRRVARAIRSRPLPAYFDLVEWLVSREHAPTKRVAREMILAKRVRANSHVLGVGKDAKGEFIAPHVSTDLMADVTILDA